MTTAAPLGWRDDWATTAWTDTLDDAGDNRLRVQLRHEPGRGVVRFLVQYETRPRPDARFRAVVRWDSAHDQPHRDRLDRAGRVVEKTWIGGKSNAEAATAAMAEARRDWQAFRAAFEGMNEP